MVVLDETDSINHPNKRTSFDYELSIHATGIVLTEQEKTSIVWAKADLVNTYYWPERVVVKITLQPRPQLLHNSIVPSCAEDVNYLIHQEKNFTFEVEEAGKLVWCPIRLLCNSIEGLAKLSRDG